MQQTIFFSGSAFGKDFLMVIVQPPCAVTHINKSAGGRLRLNSHTPLTKQSQSGLTMPLCRESMGTYQESSSHAIRQGTLSHSCLSSLSHYGLIPGLRSRISVNDLISTLKKKRRRWGMNYWTFSPNPHAPGKSNQYLCSNQKSQALEPHHCF